MEETILTNKIQISKAQFDELLKEKLMPYADEYLRAFSSLVAEIRKLFKENQLVKIMNKSCYMDINREIMFPDLTQIPILEVKPDIEDDYSEYMKKNSLIEGRMGELPTLKQLRGKLDLLLTVSDKDTYYVCINDDARYMMPEEQVLFNPYTGNVQAKSAGESNLKICVFPVNNLSFDSPTDLIMNILIPFNMCPEELSDEMVNLYRDLVLLKNTDGDYISYSSDKKIIIDKKRLLMEFIADPEKEIYNKLHWKVTEVLKEYYEIRCIGEVDMDVKEELLQCEKIRADIEAYEEKILTDPNRGHWDLWRNQSETDYTVEIAEKLVARNPICDINEDGVIAIDFGTKSTIVVYQSDIEHSLPMRIGDGNLSKETSAKQYENPTVMHFVNLEKFIVDYHSKKGRPKTEWNDLTISHIAMDQFLASSSEAYYEYLHQIKQWAGQREKQFRIQPHIGESVVLPSFLDLKDEDFNPIEIYAYYIGLYINNMRKGHGIFLDYYLSFPVTYEVKIREKIVESFEKGLKKSLPETILNNPEIMSRFKVNGDVSEPEAYAVCALQEYGFEPEDGEEIFYGIFDFGGGTTDFDFGLWKQSSKRRYDYTIENFGAGGDEFLGGENLLEMLAFEIFKNNQELMREKGYTFTLAPKCKEFLGSDALLSDSQEAEKNMHNLMKVLRPYWEEYKEEVRDGGLSACIEKIRKAAEKSAYLYEIEEQIDEIEQKFRNKEYDFCDAMNQVSALAIGYQIDFENDGTSEESGETLVVTLFDREGYVCANETLKCSLYEINQFIEDKIREGVNNFFSALLLSYQNEKVKKPTTVNIFLAGNSSKSPIVRKVFEEEIAKHQKAIKEKYQIEENVDNLFEIFPPLGTEEAYRKMEERGLPYERDNFERPTGKTGVAFGLLQCRKGGTIERISNVGTGTEIPFQYFIGWRAKKKFVIFKDDSKITKYKGKPDYNVWYKFIEADEEIFDLYYTTLPECVNGNTFVDGNAAVKRHRCNIDVVDENAFVYIRAVGPHTLEYVVAGDDDVEKSMLGEIVRRELG